jgi:hypothetical protein
MLARISDPMRSFRLPLANLPRPLATYPCALFTVNGQGTRGAGMVTIMSRKLALDSFIHMDYTFV